MVKIAISGALGKMGKKVKEVCDSFSSCKTVFGIDMTENLTNPDYPVYASFENSSDAPDVIIDFSSPANLKRIIKYATENNVNLVLCTTGYSEQDLSAIKKASESIAIFRSANMSIGVNVLIDLAVKTAETLKNFDIEIIEKHHNEKVDAPSGTAYMIADAIKNLYPDRFYVCGREGKVGKRNPSEIGIHAVRGGNIVGEHDVMFCGMDETVTLSHQATDRRVFAVGAVRAAIYLADKKNGVYNMNDLINGK